jgi:hypothetical protein
MIGVNPAEIENLDEWDLVICCSCGFIDDRSEIPGGQCAVTGEGLDWCPACLDADCFYEYSPEKAAEIAARIAQRGNA